MPSLDDRMNGLLEHTASWPEAERIPYIRAEIAKAYTQIQAETRAAMIQAHEAKFGRRRATLCSPPSAAKQ